MQLFSKQRGRFLEKANNINLQDVSFHGAILNDIEWGDITKERYMTSRKEMSDYYPTEEPKRNIIRQLKYILDSQADIINANKLYGLEMKLYGDSLSWKNFFDKLVFYFHNVSSSYSQSWILPLFWIFVIGFVFSGANCLYVKHNINEYLILGTLFFIILPIISLLSIYYKNIETFRDTVVLSFILLVTTYIFYYFTNDSFDLGTWLKFITPFSIKEVSSNDSILINYTGKVIVLYLIYQFIVAMRKDTKRK